jgi:hypothetical protein
MKYTMLPTHQTTLNPNNTITEINRSEKYWSRLQIDVNLHFIVHVV